MEITGICVYQYSNKYQQFVPKYAYHLDQYIEDDEEALQATFQQFPLSESQWNNSNNRCQIVRWRSN